MKHKFDIFILSRQCKSLKLGTYNIICSFHQCFTEYFNSQFCTLVFVQKDLTLLYDVNGKNIFYLVTNLIVRNKFDFFGLLNVYILNAN